MLINNNPVSGAGRLVIKLRLILCLLFTAVLLLGLATPIVHADVSDCPQGMSDLDCQALYGGWTKWVPYTGSNTACGDTGTSDDSSTTGTTTTTSGDDAGLPPNASAAFAYFTSHNFTAAQAAGILGNFWYESGINPTTRNSIGAYGIAQWLGSRYVSMKNWVTGEGKSYKSLEGQEDYVIHELNTTEGAAKTDLLKQTDAKKAAFSWYTYYERPNDGTYPDRETDAEKIFAKLSDQAAAPTSDGNCPGGQTVDCTTATGTAKILCEAKAYNGIYYRWGGGHQGYDAFVAGCPDPSNPPNNHPTGSPSDPTNGGLSGNPSPCATDCSGLVSIAADAAFNQKFIWTVSTLESSGQWKRISLSDIQPGDVLTQGSDHVEIVNSYSGGGTVSTFGSHKTGTQTSQVQSDTSIWDGAYRYVGPM